LNALFSKGNVYTFLEVLRDNVQLELQSPLLREGGIKRVHLQKDFTVAHEIGHAPRGRTMDDHHLEGGIMGFPNSQGESFYYFSPKTIRALQGF
jgi:predicted ATPase